MTDPRKRDLEGEGSTSGAKKYDDELEEFKKEKDPDALADEAAADPDDEEQRRAEDIGKSKKQVPPGHVDEWKEMKTGPAPKERKEDAA